MAPRKPKKDMGDDMLEGAALSAGKALEKAGVVKALLHPSAKALGDYWGKRTQQWVEGLDERRAKNVNQHMAKVKAVEKLSPPETTPTERQFASLIEWTSEAQTIDPEAEPELSALWQALLADILRNDPSADEMRIVLQQMTRADAQALLTMEIYQRPFSPFHFAFNPNRSGPGQPYLDRFKRWGLLTNTLTLRRVAARSIILIMAMIVAVAGSQMPDMLMLIGFGQEARMLPAASTVFAGSMVAVIAFSLVGELGRFGYTRLGWRLRESGERYLREKIPAAKPAETETPATKPRRARRPKSS